jgi:hypothetical protein
VSEDDKALTLRGWAMRKRDENRGKIKESVEKKEYAGKEFPEGVTERLNHAAIIRVKSVFSSTPSLTVD